MPMSSAQDPRLRERPASPGRRLPAALAIVLLGAACGDDGPPPPDSVEAASELVQGGEVGLPVASPPAVLVRDRAGNPLPGVRVQFRVAAGGGFLAAESSVTDPAGRARSGGWTLGTGSGEQRVEAAVGRLTPLRFTANAEPGVPTSVTALQGDGQTATVNAAAPVPPTVLVRDRYGNAATGTPVHFRVVAGNGSVSAPTPLVDASGHATPGEWRLGTSAGANELRAETNGLPGASFHATGLAGPLAIIGAASSQEQAAEPDADVREPPTVRLTDAFGNPIPGQPVSFFVEAGGGSITGADASSDDGGLASVGSWRLADVPEVQVLAAVTTGLPGDTVRFQAVADGFDLEVRFVSAVTDAQRAAFEAAVASWSSAVRGDVPDVSLDAVPCTPAHSLSETVDDLVVFAEVREIDGPGGILGQAGPCLVRLPGFLPIAGIMSFDAQDLAQLESAGLLDDVIEHELGHVLGIGTIWSPLELLTGAGTADPFFTGASARAAFLTVGGGSYAGNPVPVANTGGGGTRDAHWRESVFDTELMTGFLNGQEAPLSVVTIASLEDLGYQVDLEAADPYVLPGPGVAARRAFGPGIELREAPTPAPRRVDRDGRVLPR